MIKLTTLDMPVSVDLRDMGSTHHNWSHTSRSRVYLFGDRTHKVVPLGSQPARLVVVGEYLLSGRGWEAFLSLRGMLGQMVEVEQGSTLLGTALLESVRIPQVRERDSREAPIQRWEVVLLFNSPSSPPGRYVPVPAPVPAPEPPPIVPPGER